MKEGKNIDDYFAKVLMIANKMKANGERMEQMVIVEKILRSLTPKFDYVVFSIIELNNTTTMSIDDLQSSLLVHEQRMRGYKEEEQALKVTSGDKPRAREFDRLDGRGRGRGSYGGGGRGRGRQPFDKAFVECFRCHKLGHYQYQCFKKRASGAP
ncbi:hypothetical protein ACLB2K_020905 [Fragaria x ananassa]